MIKIRLAQESDLLEITEIYNSAILKTTATFDTTPKTMAEQQTWFSKHGAKHPVFVSESEGKVLGWASFSPWSDRGAYSETAEISFYVHEDHRGKGIGRSLFEKLDNSATQLGFHTLVSRIATESEASIHLHKFFGFIHVGTMREVGRKFGRLLDIHIMQKIY